MFRERINENQDGRKIWLTILQSKFDIDEKTSKALDKKLRACFALNYDMAKVKTAILNFLREHNRQVAEEDIDVDGIFTTNAGKRRYRRWPWQENLFCVIAYLLSTAFFVIDSINFGCNALAQVSCQAIGTFLAVVLFCYIDSKWRGNTKWELFFSAANTFMPGATIVAYFLFYLLKFIYIIGSNHIWHTVMITVIIVYVVAGVVGTFWRYRYYREVDQSLK